MSENRIDPRKFLEETPQLDTTVVRWSQLSAAAIDILQPQLREIFFDASSKKTFKDEADRNHFFDIWCGDYFKHYPEFFYLMVDAATNLLCYVAICPDSMKGLSVLRAKSLDVFKDEYDKYPAHLHMNTHKDYRGLGLGRTILVAIEADLKMKNIHGLHLITEKFQRNFLFYSQNGFDFQIEKKYLDNVLCFMGKKLS